METNSTLMNKVVNAFSGTRNAMQSKLLVFVLGALFISLTSKADIITTLGTVSSCPGQNILVPINVQNFNNVAAINIQFTYDTTIMSPILSGGYIANTMNPGISSAMSYFVNAYASGGNVGTVGIAAFALSGSVSLGNALLVTLQFHIHNHNGYTPLVFDLSNGEANCNYSDEVFNLLPAQWVNGDVHTSPSISNQPSNLTLTPGGSGTFTVTALEPTSFLWYVSTDGGSNYNPLSNTGVYSGVTTNTLTITGATNGMNQYKYRCTIGGTCSAPYNTMNSDAATLTVSVLPPTAYTMTYGGNYCPNAAIPGSLVGLSNSEVNVTYQLLLNSVPTGGTYAGTGSALNFGLQLASANFYRVKATNSGGTTLSTDSVQVSTWLLPNGSIGGASAQTVCAGQPASLSFQLVSGTMPYSFTFRRTDANGSHDSTINNVNTHNPPPVSVYPTINATYTLISVSDAHCTGNPPYSGSITVTVNPASTANAFNNGPVCEGQLLSLTSTTNTGISWLWTLNGGSFPVPASQNMQNPTPFVATQADSGTYTVRVQNAFGCITYATTHVVVNPPTPAAAGAITGSSSVCAGQQNVSYSVGAITNAVTYIWALPAGASIASGSGTNSITVNFSGSAVTGNISVNGHNGCGDGLSSTFGVTVHALPTASAGNNGPICAQSTLNLTSGGGSTYTWSGPGGYTSGAQNPSITNAQTGNSGTYNVTVADAFGCSAVATTNAVVNPLPTASANSNSPVCAGSALNLGSNGGNTYNWSGPNSYSSTQQNPTILNVTVAASGTYLVTVTNTFNCSSIANTSVTVNPKPTVAIGSNSPLCAGQTLNLNSSGGTGYSWTGPNGFNSIQQNPSITNVTAAATGTYNVTVTNTFNCTNTGNTAVIVHTNPVAGASTTTPNIPQGGTATLNGSASGGSGSFSYSWSPAGLLTNPTDQNPTTVALSSTTTFTLTVTDLNYSCTGTAQVTVTVMAGPALQVNPTALPNTVCAGTQVQLNANATGGSGSYTYAWTSTPAGFTSSISNPTVTPSVSTTYHVNVNDGINNVNGDVAVTVNALPTASAGSNSPVCAGSALNLSSNGGTSYSWSGPNGYTSTQQNPAILIVTTAAAGVYTVTVTNAAGCASTATTTVVVHNNPVTGASTTTPSIPSGSTAVLNGSASGGSGSYGYSWSPAILLVNPTTQNPTTVALTSTTTFTLTVTDITFGCTGTAQVTVTVTANPVLQVNPAALPNSICPGQQVQLQANPSGGTGTYTYSWTSTPAGFTSNLANPTVTPSGSTIYHVNVNDGVNNVNGDVSVTVNALPTASAGSNSPVCEGGILNLNANGGSSYSWSGPNGFTSTQQNPSINNVTFAAQGNYHVTVTNAANCSSQAATGVVVNGKPVAFNVTGGGSFCQGGTGVNVGLDNSQSGITYNLYLNGSSTGNSVAGSDFSISFGMTTTVGTYTVMAVDDATGCTATMNGNAVVSINLPPLACVGGSQTIPYNTSTTLTGSICSLPPKAGTYSYSWTPAALLIDPTIQNPTTVNLITTTTFHLVITNTSTGCVSLPADVIIHIAEPLNVTASSDVSTVCAGSPVGLHAIVTGGSGTYTYAWTSNPAGFTSNIANPVASPMVTTTYTVSVDDGTNVATSDVTVTVNPLPQMFNITGGGSYCEGGAGMPVGLDGSQTGITYTLYYNGNPTAYTQAGTGSAISFGTILSSGSSPYTINAVDDNTGCAVAMNGQVSIVANPLPSVTIQPFTITINTGSNGNFIVVANNTTDYLWQQSTDGGNTWSDLANAGMYSGVFTSTLQLTNVPLSANGYMFHCLISNSNCSSVSNPATLNVQNVVVNIITSVPFVTACPGNLVTVPVDVQNFNGVAAISLALNYDTTVLVFSSFQNLNPEIHDPFLFTLNPDQGVVYISYFSLTPTTIASGTLVDLVFNYNGGSTPLTWSMLSPELNQYSDIDGVIQPAVFIDGGVSPATPAPMVTSDPTNQSASVGSNAVFSITASGADTYQWQENTGGGWYDLGNNLMYDGVNTPDLTITGVSLGMNGYEYRCIAIESTCMQPDTSLSAFLYVNPIENEVITTAGSEVACPGSQVIVPVTVENLLGVSAISLSLNYDPAVLDYTNFQNLNPVLTANNVNINSIPGNWRLSWFDITPITLVQGTLLELIFNYSGGSTNLSWDLATSGNCEYDNEFGYPFSAIFNDGSVTPGGSLPIIVTQPSDITVTEGGNPVFMVSATNADSYAWQESHDFGNTWSYVYDDGYSYSGTSTPNLELPNVYLGWNNYQYRCILMNGNCSIATDAATLTVLPLQQNIITTAGVATACPGTQVIVPVTVSDLTNIGAISLTLNYDQGVLSYVGYQNLNPALNPSFVNMNSLPGDWRFSYFSIDPLYLSGGTLVELIFNYTGGSTNLTWDVVNSGNCEYDDSYGNTLPASYTDGLVSPSSTLPVINTQPLSTTVNAGNSTIFHVGASNVATYQWYESTDGGTSWNMLSEGGIYSGVNTPDLMISAVIPGMDNYEYYCALENEGCQVNSDIATLHVVTTSLISTTAGDVTGCPGSEVIVPITVQDLYNVGAISLTLNYNPAVLTYTGFANANPAINPVYFTVNSTPGNWKLSWFDVTPVNIASGNLLDLIFNYNGGSTNLTWDLVNSGNCEYDDSDGNPLAATYTDGSVSSSGLVPLITVQPTNVNANDGDMVTFSVVATNATGYQWQESTDGGSLWNDLIDGGIYSGVNTADLMLTAHYPANNYQYRCIVTNLPCSATSDAAVLHVINPGSDIITTAANISECPGNQVIVPVTAQYLYNVGAISLSLLYDPTVLNYVGYQDLNPVFDPNFILINSIPGEWRLSYFNIVPVNLYSDVILDLVFNYNGGTSALTWDVSVPGNCEYDDADGNALPAIYNNGSVQTNGYLAEITSQPVSVTVNHHDNTSFSVTANNATAYQWQLSTDGGTNWMNLTNNAHYSGVNTSTLDLTDAIYLYNSYQYRCVVTGEFCTTPSDAAILTVNPTEFTIVTTATSVAACPGSDIIVPITVTDFYNVASISLKMNYDPGILTYNGYQNLNPALSTGLISPTPGQFIMSWYSITPANLGDDVLVELKFTYNGGVANMDWDLATSGACEYTDFNVNPLAASYVNGTVTSSALAPVVTSDPSDVTAFAGQDVSFTAGADFATNYQWQVSNDGGATWNNLSDDATYSGVNSSTLNLTSVGIDLNGNLYRVMVDGTCGLSETSGFATLMVIIQPTLITTAGQVETCAGSVGVPVTVEEFNNVTMFSLMLDFDPSVLTFVDITDLNPALSGGTFMVTPAPGMIMVDFMSLTPVNIGSGQLFNVNFTSDGGTSALTWDASIYQNSYGLTIPTMFNDGSATVDPLPLVFDVTGGGSYCDGGTGVPVGLNGSQSGVTYTLYFNGDPTGNSVMGNDGPITFGPQATPGIYSVVAMYESTGCNSDMNGSVEVIHYELPASFAILGGGPYCTGDQGVIIGLAGSEVGIDYELLLNGTQTGNIVSGTGDPIDFGYITTPGNYTAYGLSGATGCIAMMDGSTNVIVNPLPDVTMDPLAPVCMNVQTVALTGNPAGGIFTGTGVDGNEFLPGLSGTGTFVITYTYTSEFGCTNSASQEITVNGVPSMEFSAPANICFGQTGSVVLNFTGGVAPWTVVINDGMADNTITTSDNPYTLDLTPSATTDYTIVSLTDANGCTSDVEINFTITVLPLTELVSSPMSVSLDEGGNTFFAVMANNATSYQWQLSTDGGLTWNDLMNDAIYGGVNSDNLTVTGVSLDMNGNMYQCIIGGLCPPPVTSGNAVLTVSPIIITIAGTVTQCAGDIIVPVTVHHFFGVAATSLTLNYNDTELTYTGYQDVNTEISSGTFGINAINGQVKIGFFSLTPANIGDGLLVNLIFHSNGGFSNLTWDNLTPGNCEYQNILGDNITSQYVDGSLTVNPLPTAVVTAMPATICLNDASTINVDLTGSAPWNVTLEVNSGGMITSSNQVVTESPWTFTVNPTETTTYTVTALADNNGCVGTDMGNATVTVNPLPNFNVTSSNNEVCAGQTVTFTYEFTSGVAPWTVTYLANGDELTFTTSDNPYVSTFIPDQTTQYTMESVSDGNGCTQQVSQDWTLIVHPLPVVTLDPLSNVCIDAGDVMLNGLPAGGTYSGTGVSGNMFSPAVAGPGTWTITYTFTDEFGCMNSASQEITVYPLPVITFDPLAPVCLNAQPFDLMAEPQGGTFTGTGVVNNTFNPSVAGVGTFMITYMYMDDNGCSNSASQNITVNELPGLQYTAPTELCAGETGSLVINFTSGLAPWTVVYNDGNGDVSFTTSDLQYTINLTPAETTDYTIVSVSDANGCTVDLEMMFTITVHPLTQLMSSPVSVSLDEGGNTHFSVSADNATTYQWQVSMDNGMTWSDLMNDAVYSGVNTDYLTLTAVSLDMSGYEYHCIVSGICPPAITSGNATLTVTPIIVTIAGTVTNCAGDIIVPVSVLHSYGVAANSLTLNYNSSILSYVGYQDVNTEWNSGYYVIDAINSQVKIGFFTITPANIGNGLVVNLIFHSDGGYSDLTWDNLTPGNCEYQNLNGNNITSQYINGSVTVNPLPTAMMESMPGTVCLNESSTITVNLTGSAPWDVMLETDAGGVQSFSNQVVTASPWVFTVTPSETSTYSIIALSDNNGCVGTQMGSTTVTVNPLPSFTVIRSSDEVCAGQSVDFTFEFMSGVAPWTVTYIANGVMNSFTTSDNPYVMSFVPAQTTQYQMVSITDANGCMQEANDVWTLIVHPLPVVTLDPVSPVCIDAQAVVLNGQPMGGTFTGNGVSGNLFNPADAGLGTWTITYTYTNEFGCTSSASTDITVNPTPVVTLDPLADVCADHAPVDLNGMPAGGVYSGAGVTGNMFYPANVGAGSYIITYTYTNQYGCTGSATQQIIVHPAPVVTLLPLADVCHDAGAVMLNGAPAGGTYSGPGVTNNMFDPASAGVGTWTITYTYVNEFGCSNFASQTITVNANPTAFSVVGGGSYCEGSGGLVVALNGSTSGIQYNLYLNGVPTGAMVTGTGGIISFGAQTNGGVYTVMAVNPVTGCTKLMNNSSTIIVNPVPIVYAGGYSVICKGTGTMLNATVVGGTAPFSYQWIPATGLDNPTILNPTASPLVTTYYTLLVNDNNGCGSSDNALVIVNPTPVVNAGPNVTVYQGTPTTLQGSTNGGTAPLTILWTPSTGLSNPGILHPLATPLVTTQYTLHITDANGCTGTASVTITVSGTPLGYNVTGMVTYDNSVSTALNNTTVTLNNGANTFGTTITDNFGDYVFGQVPNATYTTHGASSKPWGGGNSVDALLIARHFQNLQPLTGLRLLAGDCDGNGVVNANDALLVMLRSVVLINSFPVPDWVFETKTITVNNNNVIDDFKGLCVGDVNGSYVPAAKYAPRVTMEMFGSQYVSSFSEFTIPIHAGTNMTLGAASLIINYPYESMDILDITTTSNVKNSPDNQLVYNVVNGKIYLSWYSLSPVSLSANDDLFLIKVRSKNINNRDLTFSVEGESLLGTPEAAVIEHSLLTMPKLQTATGDFNLSNNYPNPFSYETEIQYVLPETGKVKLLVYNVVGEVVAELVDAEQTAGTYTVKFDGSALTQGVYIYTIKVNGDTRAFEQSKRMVITR